MTTDAETTSEWRFTVAQVGALSYARNQVKKLVVDGELDLDDHTFETASDTVYNITVAKDRADGEPIAVELTDDQSEALATLIAEYLDSRLLNDEDEDRLRPLLTEFGP